MNLHYAPHATIGIIAAIHIFFKDLVIEMFSRLAEFVSKKIKKLFKKKKKKK